MEPNGKGGGGGGVGGKGVSRAVERRGDGVGEGVGGEGVEERGGVLCQATLSNPGLFSITPRVLQVWQGTAGGS